MRADALGMFWEDVPVVKAGSKRGPRERGPMPRIPATGWKPPSEFPNLSAAKVIGFDVEGYDPELMTAGPGWGRGKSHLIGISMAVEDGTSWYFPFGHGMEKQPDGQWKQVLPPEEAAMNMDYHHVMSFAKHTLRDNRPKVGANLIYDYGALLAEGVEVGGPLYDIQFAEALLNSEAPDVSLDNLGENYLGVGKVTSILYDWLASWCGGKASDRQRANMFLSPPSLAGPYAEGDASMPIGILTKQWPLLIDRGVLDLFHLECKLIRLLVAMRMKGAPVDVPYAERFYEELDTDMEEQDKLLRDIVGQTINPNARDSMKAAFEKLGLKPPTKVNKKGEEVITFSAPALEAMPSHPFINTVLERRRIEKVKNTFVKGYILDKNVRGKIHCSFHPLKGDKGGTRSGRFSSSDPNLQNIPVRTVIGKRVRKAFVASQGHRWRKWDYSQIEYRMLAHHAVGEGSEELRQIFINDPEADYHDITIALIKKLTGVELARRPAKNINFGLIYGMSEAKLAGDLGLTSAKGKELFRDYHAAAPFARATMEAAANDVHRLGYVETILGRRSDFPFWGKKGWGEDRGGYEYDIACQKWGAYNIERAFTHKALNRRLQGGAADVMKKAMVAAYEAGMFEDDACGMPCLTVHDELDFDDGSDPDNTAWLEFQNIMENALPQIKVPVRMDGSIGPNWGEAD